MAILKFINKYLENDAIEEDMRYLSILKYYNGIEAISDLQYSENEEVSKKAQKIKDKYFVEF